MRFALGTASFGMSYGINNCDGKVSRIMTEQILEYAASKKISVLDTAMVYGDSEDRLGKIGVDSYKVISKLPPIPENISHIQEWIFTQAKSSIERMKIKNLYALLLHSPEQLLEPFGKEIYNALQELKNRNFVKKIGISIYNPDDLNSLLSVGDFDLVQCPMNIIDQRLVNSGWLEKLKSRNIEVHVRSCFLQGLLLMEKENIPEKFNTWDSIWNEWHTWLEQNNYSALHACLSYCLSFKDLDCLIVGVENISQLEEIISVYKETKINRFPNISSDDIRLINPAKWDNL